MRGSQVQILYGPHNRKTSRKRGFSLFCECCTRFERRRVYIKREGPDHRSDRVPASLSFSGACVRCMAKPTGRMTCVIIIGKSHTKSDYYLCHSGDSICPKPVSERRNTGFRNTLHDVDNLSRRNLTRLLNTGRAVFFCICKS